MLSDRNRQFLKYYGIFTVVCVTAYGLYKGYERYTKRSVSSKDVESQTL